MFSSQVLYIVVGLLFIIVIAVMPWSPALVSRERTQPCDSEPFSNTTSTTISNLRRAKTVRISRIPRSMAIERLQTWLNALSGSTDPATSESPTLLSFAPNTIEFSQATVTFKIIPEIMTGVEHDTHTSEGPDDTKLALDVHFKGMTVLYDPVHVDAGPAVADIIALPGLGSHALGAWKSPTGHDVWLRDLLPKDEKLARTIIYGYDTDLSKGANWKNTIYELANSMLDSLQRVRDKDVGRSE